MTKSQDTTAPTTTEASTTRPPVVVATVAPVVSEAPAPVETFIVTNVVNGDTLDLDNGERVRLVGIDTPEKGQCGADEAAFALTALTLNKTITLEPSDEDRDKYGRLLRYVWSMVSMPVDNCSHRATPSRVTTRPTAMACILARPSTQR